MFFFKCFPAIANSVVLIFHFLFSVGARKLSMTGSIRNFENQNFTPKSRILVSLKVKLPDMTDWHIFSQQLKTKSEKSERSNLQLRENT